ncbi:PREDICTED: acyl-coenzyme A thioesterase THEM5 isoform X2 [Chinchilla lanigera]|uniref:acyl-coenzyme A thioesterase THEM5 isoform X2 n=1 Tax=Chinchilla lanigera TaxID=34839 RepID=UPI000697416C|nr:PREDICTED: acyl-coenzyme A thioesterase THEM5 isoform X2 [Chinchilla lanigera]
MVFSSWPDCPTGDLLAAHDLPSPWKVGAWSRAFQTGVHHYTWLRLHLSDVLTMSHIATPGTKLLVHKPWEVTLKPQQKDTWSHPGSKQAFSHDEGRLPGSSETWPPHSPPQDPPYPAQTQLCLSNWIFHRLPGLKILSGEDRLEGLCSSQCQLGSRHAEPVPRASGEDQLRRLDQTALIQVQQRPHPRAKAPIWLGSYLRCIQVAGQGYEYVIFFHPAKQKSVCLFQPGPYLEGAPGFAHGGSLAAMMDETFSKTAYLAGEGLFTLSLNIRFKNLLPVGSLAVLNVQVEKIEDQKLYMSCIAQSRDQQTVFAKSSGVFLQLQLEAESPQD